MSFSATSDAQVVGIDAGATLCKIAYMRGKSIVTHTLPSRDTAGIRDYIATRHASRVVLAGGGARKVAAELPELSVALDTEFESWARGAPALAEAMGLVLPRDYLLVSLGTGTSILRIAVDAPGPVRVGGSALGGGTLMGLGQLLVQARDFDQLARLARIGDRSRVDLLVGDIYPEPDTPLPREFNAASFAKLASRSNEDLADALMGLVGENIGLLCGQLANRFELDHVVYCGSTLNANESLERVLVGVARMHGHRALFLDRGAFCGALGASLLQPVRS